MPHARAIRRRSDATPGAKPAGRGGFSLVEVLVSVTIIVVLMVMTAAAVNSVRSNSKAQETRQLIAKLDAILTQQLESYASKDVDMSNCPAGTSKAAYRAWFIRRNMITGDMPDRWVDVEFMANNPAQFTSAPQRTYIAIWNSLGSAQQTEVKKFNSSAECLFMIVMQGGIADCLDCGSLTTAQIGDEDGDGMPEFWDAWGNPIGFLLWAPALRLPAASGTLFFSGSRALDPAWTGSPRPTLGMRPLIYSGGADEVLGYDRLGEEKTLDAGATPILGADCGSPGTTSGGPADSVNPLVDNITNLDEEAKKP